MKGQDIFSVFLLTEAVHSLGLLITKALNESCRSEDFHFLTLKVSGRA
jgi:hypothetical protein